MASKAVLVAQREYLENVRTKTFWIGILVLPLIIVIATGIGWLMSRTKATQPFTVVDRTPYGLGAEVVEAAEAGTLLDVLRSMVDGKLPDDHPAMQALQNISPDMLERSLSLIPDEARQRLEKEQEKRKERYRYVSLQDLGLAGLPREEQDRVLNDKIETGDLFAYFVFDKDPIESLADNTLTYHSNNLTDHKLRTWLADTTTRVIQQKRILRSEIDPTTARWLRAVATFSEKQSTSGRTEAVNAEQKANKFAPVVFVYLLWIAVFTAAQMLLTNTVEEKSNRIIEVLLSSASPGQLMSGKIWGIGATGLTIIASWVFFGLIAAWVVPKLVPDLAELNLADIIGDPLYIASFLGYFLTGYLMFAAVLVAIGSVCNSLKEAQNLLQPVFLLLMIPLFAMIPIVQEPNGLMAKVFTYIPIYTPFAMMNRASGPPPPWEYALTTVLILVSVWFAFKAAGKVFRVGVLMTGKPPKLKEILGWLREK